MRTKFVVGKMYRYSKKEQWNGADYKCIKIEKGWVTFKRKFGTPFRTIGNTNDWYLSPLNKPELSIVKWK